jgi:hypothetical protein
MPFVICHLGGILKDRPIFRPKKPVRRKNNVGRQMGSAETITDFSRMNNSMISIDTDIELSDGSTFGAPRVRVVQYLLAESHYNSELAKIMLAMSR